MMILVQTGVSTIGGPSRQAPLNMSVSLSDAITRPTKHNNHEVIMEM
jgi:hypothetical protein